MLLSANLQKLLLPPEKCSLCPGRSRQLLRLVLLRGLENPGVSLSLSQGGKPGTYIALYYLNHLTMTEAAIVTHIDGPCNGGVGAALSRQGGIKQSSSLGRSEAMSALLDWVYAALSIGNKRTLRSDTKERLVC